MNNVEAKFILQGYRPNGADASDPAFTAALAQARHDPELRDWFAREQGFDRAVSAKLAEVPVPAGLREAILAGGRVTAPATARLAWWRRPAGYLALAASVAVIFALGSAWWPKAAAAETELAAFALHDVTNNPNHGGHGAEAAALQAALTRPDMHLGHGLAIDDAALRQSGCRTVSFQGHDLLEVCFKRDGVWFHCYIAQRSDFPAMAVAAVPQLVNQGSASIASWADSAHVFVVVSETGRAALQRLL
jgi:hypothetical protein